MQSINTEETSLEKKEVEPVGPVQMNIYQSNTYSLSWLHFDDEPAREAASEGPTALHIRFYSLSSNLEYRPRHDNSISYMAVGRFIEIQSNLRRKKLHRTNQCSNFLGGSFNNRDNVRAPIHFRRQSQPQHLKRCFFLKNRPIHFHINSPVFLDRSNETS